MKIRILKKFLPFYLILNILFVFFSCSSSQYTIGESEYKIVTSSFISFDIVQNIIGNKAKITLLNANGMDIHSYEPTVKDLKAVNEANLFICLGKKYENWVEDLISNCNNPSLKVIELTKLVDLIECEKENNWQNHDEHEHEHEHEDHHNHERDEHIWFSINNMKTITTHLFNFISNEDKNNLEYYTNNYESFFNSLSNLEEKYSTVMNRINSKFIFADRFPFVYLMHDYQKSYMAAFGGCSTETDSSFETFTKILEVVSNENIKAIFIIDSNNDTLAKSIASKTNCKIVILDSIQSVTSKKISDGYSYIYAMENNLDKITDALLED